MSDYELVLTPPARRAPGQTLPEPIAAAATEFLTGSLIAAPHRVGKPLRFELAGVWSARRGTYRVLYRINEQAREVVVLRVEHRKGCLPTTPAPPEVCTIRPRPQCHRHQLIQEPID